MCMIMPGDGTNITRPNWGKSVTVKVDPTETMTTLVSIEDAWKQFAGNQALEYDHFDKYYAQLYQYEQQVANIISLFAVLTIFIAALGLLGLVAFTVQKQTKEIGIRKVLGASVLNVLLLLSKDMLKLMAISIVIAILLANYIMQRWLEKFAYRIDMGMLVFIQVPLGASIVAILAVVWQFYHAAAANPVKSLRYE